jgi:hypothetical protein
MYLESMDKTFELTFAIIKGTVRNQIVKQSLKELVLSVVILQVAQDGESIDVLSFSSQQGCQPLVWPEEPSIFWVLEMVVPDVLPNPTDNFTSGG